MAGITEGNIAPHAASSSPRELRPNPTRRAAVVRASGMERRSPMSHREMLAGSPLPPPPSGTAPPHHCFKQLGAYHPLPVLRPTTPPDLCSGAATQPQYPRLPRHQPIYLAGGCLPDEHVESALLPSVAFPVSRLPRRSLELRQRLESAESQVGEPPGMSALSCEQQR